MTFPFVQLARRTLDWYSYIRIDLAVAICLPAMQQHGYKHRGNQDHRLTEILADFVALLIE